MQAFGVHTHIHSDDLVGTGAGLGEHLSCEESRAIGGNIPTVLQEESLEVVHLFTHTLTSAQTLQTHRIEKLRAVSLFQKH